MPIRRRLPSRLVLGIIIVLGIAGVGLAMVYLSPSEPVPATSSQPRFNTDPIPDTPSQGALHQGENTTAVAGDDFGGLGSNLGGERLAVTTTAEPSTSAEPSTATHGEKQTTTQPATTHKTEEAATTTSKQEQLTEAKTQLGEKEETTTTTTIAYVPSGFLSSKGTGDPQNSGLLTKISGTGNDTITFSSYSFEH